MSFIRTTWLIMNERLRTLIWTVVLTGLSGLLLYSYLHTSENGFFPTTQNFRAFVISSLLGCIVGACINVVNIWLNKMLSWRGSFAMRFTAGFIAYTTIAFGMIAGITYLIVKLGQGEIIWSGFNIGDDDLTWKLIIVVLVGSFIYSIVYALLYSYNQYAHAQIETMRQERKQLELQFEALKSQISPHYLFNSLNTISSLIYNDPQTAEQFIRRLAQTYQYILSTRHKKYVSLQEEIEFVKSYYYLLRIRFQQLLNIEINIPNNIIQSAIPPLTLQLLVENAVKHNPVSNEKPLYIYISAIDNTKLKVVNTKNQHNISVPSTRIGLDNIRQRYKFFTTKEIEVRDEEQFTVLLPVILHQQLNRAS